MPRFVLPLFLLLLGGCAPPPVRVHIDAEASPTANFAGYRTYAWLTEALSQSVGQAAGDTLTWRIRNGVDAELAGKGYVKQSGRADVLVDYHLVQREMTTDSFKDYLAYRQRGGQAEIQEAYVTGYVEGSLVLEFFDARSQQLVWRGTATAVVNPDPQPDKLQESIRRLLERFPSR
jgi:hypothetical protein